MTFDKIYEGEWLILEFNDLILLGIPFDFAVRSKIITQTQNSFNSWHMSIVH